VEILEPFVLGVGVIKAIKVRIHIHNMDIGALMSMNSLRIVVDERAY